MKKTIVLALGAALMLSGVAAKAEEKAAPANKVAATVTAPANQTAEANKPASTVDAAKPVATATAPTTATANPAVPTTTTNTAAVAKTEARFEVKGFVNPKDLDALKVDLAKANGVFSVNGDTTGKFTALIDTTKTSADKLCTWVKTNKPSYTCTIAK